MMELRKTFRFEASHLLPRHVGKCRRLHGHGWVLHVSVKGSVSEETGFVMDYADISSMVKPLVEELDHRHLGAFEVWENQVCYHIQVPKSNTVSWLAGVYPSSENLLIAIGRRIKERGLDWYRLALEETCTSYAELERAEFERMMGESAQNI